MSRNGLLGFVALCVMLLFNVADAGRDGSGNYTAPASTWNPVVSGTRINSADFNALLTDIESALTSSIAKNGETPTTAVIPFASGIKADTIAENSSATGVTIDGLLIKDGALGSGTVLTLPQINDTSSDHQYVFGVSELAADRTVTLPLLTGNDTFVFEAFAATLTNKVVALGSNTVSGTFAQFNTAVTDATLVDLDDSQTLTNKTLTAPVISTISNTGTTTLFTDTDTVVGKATTDTFTNKTFDANATGNSLSNVDVADLANGTDGELITWSSSAAPATVAVGTSGQVLTSNGVGAAPTFQSGGTVTASSTDTFTNKTIDANATGNSITNIDLTADVINDLPVAEGGTGSSTAAGALANLAALGEGKHTIWVGAPGWISLGTVGAACSNTWEVGSNPDANIFGTCDYQTGADEYAQFSIQMPENWNEGTLIAQVIWSHPSTTTNFGISIFMECVAYANDDAGDASFGTAIEMQDTGGTTDDIYISPESSAITCAGTPGAEELVLFQIYRDVSDGGDTLAVDARLHGIKIHYTVDAANDN